MQCVVIADDNRVDWPMPDGSAREFMAGFGDFPVVLVNAELSAKETTSHALFPSANVMAPNHLASTTLAQSTIQKVPVEDWGAEQVREWLASIGMQDRFDTLSAKGVDNGNALLKVTHASALLTTGNLTSAAGGQTTPTKLAELAELANPFRQAKFLKHAEALQRNNPNGGARAVDEVDEYIAALDARQLQVQLCVCT